MADVTVPTEIALTQHDGRAWTTSLDVAEKFGKRHDNVLRTLQALECSREFLRLNFEEISVQDSYGRPQRAYRISRDGFVFLAMGFTGAEAAKWKEKYIAAFNALEQQARAIVAQDDRWVREMMERSHQLQAALVSTMQATRIDVGGIKAQVDQVAEEQKKQSADIYELKSRLRLRAHPDKVTKEALQYAMARRGWRCPCCERPSEPELFEVDHFFDVGRSKIGDLWMICKPCHSDLTAGRLARHDVRSTFDAFQEFAHRTSPQRSLDFGVR